jgi:UDP-4-keto-D-QuiNAc 4-reductase
MTLGCLVTGATGFVGSALVQHLAREPRFFVTAVVRDPAVRLPEGVVPLVALGQTPFSEALPLEGVSVVVYCAARVHVMNDIAPDPLAEFRKVNVVGTLNLARQAAKAGVRRFVFLSSIKVNGGATLPGQAFRANDAPAPEDAYGQSKWEAEDGLQMIAHETGMEVVVIRPPLVYGPGVKANFLELLKIVDKGFPLPFRRIRNRRSMIYLGNLVDAIHACAVHPNAAGEVFLVSDEQDLSTPELIMAIARAMGRPPRLFPVPQKLLEAGLAVSGRKQVAERICGSLTIDSSKIRYLMDWIPPYTVNQGLQRTVDWYLRTHRAGQ